MTAPCKDCEERHRGFHSHCEAYKAYHVENTKRCAENRRRNDIREYQKDSIERYMKRTKWRK